MDIDNKKNNDDSKESQKDSSKNDIPLWLQGLNDSEIEQTEDQNSSDETKTNNHRPKTL